MTSRPPWIKSRIGWIALAAIDATGVYASYLLIFWLNNGSSPVFRGTLTAVCIAWITFSYLLGGYSLHKEGYQHARKTVLRVIRVICLSAACLAALNWITGLQDYRTLKEFAVPALCLAGAWSASAQLIGNNLLQRNEDWIIISSEQEAQIIEIESRASGNRCKITTKHMGVDSREVMDLKIPPNGLAGIAISQNETPTEEAIDHLLKLRSYGVTILSLVNWAETMLQRIPPELLDNKWLVSAEGFSVDPERFRWRAKRLGDVVGSCFLLVAAMPLMLAAAILIKLDDGGPIFFSQLRTGAYGRTFTLTKFRSMSVNAEETGAQWSKPGDPRITRLGSILRKFRIDELPQLINVLNGDMSLIGPRPERPEIEAILEQNIPHYRLRHWIRPGLSGWAQVCYPYGASMSDSRNKLSYDLFYIRNYSIALDILVLIKTIQMVLRGNGHLAVRQTHEGPF